MCGRFFLSHVHVAAAVMHQSGWGLARGCLCPTARHHVYKLTSYQPPASQLEPLKKNWCHIHILNRGVLRWGVWLDQRRMDWFWKDQSSFTSHCWWVWFVWLFPSFCQRRTRPCALGLESVRKRLHADEWSPTAAETHQHVSHAHCLSWPYRISTHSHIYELFKAQHITLFYNKII